MALNFIQASEVFVTERNFNGPEVVVELVHPLRADDHTCDRVSVQEPGQRDLRDRSPMRVGNRPHRVDDVEPLVLVERRKLERRTPRIRFAVSFTAELPREEASG